MTAILKGRFLVVLLSVSVITVLGTAHSGSRRSREITAVNQLAAINERLDKYRQESGHYPGKLEDVPGLSQGATLDPWGIRLAYKHSNEKGELVLRSVGYETSRAQNRIRLTLNSIATGCSVVLMLLILGFRFRQDRRWPTRQSLPVLLSYAVALYAQLADKGMRPLGKSPICFYALLAVAVALTLLALVLVVFRRDLLYYAALVIAPYAVVSVILLVS